MFTQKDYSEGVCTYDQFLDQFVDDRLIEIVRVGIGERRIKNSKHPEFNDIYLQYWDMICPAVQRHVKQKAKDLGAILSIAFLTAVQKQAAKRIKRER